MVEGCPASAPGCSLTLCCAPWLDNRAAALGSGLIRRGERLEVESWVWVGVGWAGLRLGFILELVWRSKLVENGQKWSEIWVGAVISGW